jgi:NADPH-dependent curcumin reductase CurA
MKNTQVVLARRPAGIPRPADFRVVESEVREPGEGEFLVENLYLSLDAGFRNWMNEDSGDEVLPAMPLDHPVMGLTLGRVLRSRHPEYAVGELLMARLRWEEYSTTAGDDFLVRLRDPGNYPLHYHLGVLGDTGMSAYFGLQDIGRPRPGETVLVSAAGGAVGSVAGQIARLMGARTVGFVGSEEKAERICRELGYDAAIDHRAHDVERRLAEACPKGVDVYFDSVGGPLLEKVLAQINPGARIAFCGAVTAYNAVEPIPGPANLFELVLKSARLEGFMTHLRVDRYPEARRALCGWLDEGRLRSIETIHEGVAEAGVGFCHLFEGRNFGKSIVRVRRDAGLQ